MLCCVVLCCVVLCCVVLCSGIVSWKRYLSRQILHYLKYFLCLKTCLLQCYELLRRRTNFDDYRIFVHFDKIVKVLGQIFVFYCLPCVRFSPDFASTCLYRSLSLSCTRHRPFPVQVTAPFLYASLPLTK